MFRIPIGDGGPSQMRIPRTALALLLLASPVLAESDVEDPWFASGRDAVKRARERTPEMETAKNAILFVGDGMGVSTITAARILEGQLRGERGEENRLSFETLPHLALSKTYNTNQQVADSAGTMTAMACGVKTKAGVLGVSDRVRIGDHESVAESRVASILEQAEERGLSTGIVTTTSLTHATPAALYSHVPNRDWENDTQLSDAARKAGFPDIARQLVELPNGDGIEVALGGGRSHFLPANGRDPEEPTLSGVRWDERDLTAEWRARSPGSVSVWNREQFEAVDAATTDHLLGLFDASHMEFEVDRGGDRGGEPSLSEMTAKAIEILSRNPRGFFLMVEGGRIDHGHHAGNALRALTETIELSHAVRTALEKTRPEETLIVVTADHSHVFTISGYPTRGNDILGKVIGNDRQGIPADAPAVDQLGLTYTTLGYQNGPGYPGASDSQPEGPKRLPHFPREVQGITAGRPDLENVDTTDPGHLQEAAIPLPSETHGGEDVTIHAGGPGAALFDGVQEQHFIYHALVEALGWNRAVGVEPGTGGGAPGGVGHRREAQ
jgi:alkaline phosphatase